MSRDQVARRCRRLVERLSQPSSAAGLAALLALLMPQLADYAPAIVDLALTVVAVGAAIVAMVMVEAFLAWTRDRLGVAAHHDWLTGYYQFCNRLAVLDLLNEHGAPAHPELATQRTECNPNGRAA